MNLFFICSRNQWRSRTAETIFRNHPLHRVRSAGTENEARIRVNEKMIAWAEIILVMEKHHRQRLL
jgi:protein-tyrosine phosphatase